ncbi:hypothetical protein [Alicycliphilus denitrificans]|uniref:hypothetical protein n=1 Tax=Alicycliphilus denitrificans TaxID=179636 RepID=UPI00384A7DA3
MDELKQDSGYEEILVLIDGDFSVIVVMSAAYRDEDAPAYLLKHENGAYQRVGSCVIGIDDTWSARISVVYTGEASSEFIHIGDFDSRADAIVHLWQRRRVVSFLPE